MHTIVVGAGLAGLFVATRLAGAGHTVTVLERSREPGGRARTTFEAGFSLNLGPHALYRAGAAARALQTLGIAPSGGVPPTYALAADRDDLAPLPFGPWAVATSPILSGGERWELARRMTAIGVANPASLVGVTVADWLADASPAVRDVLGCVVRVSTYADRLDRMDAGAAVAQVQRALRGVRYLDGGWQSLVDALRSAALARGATIRTGARAESVAPGVVRTADAVLAADHVVLCVGPSVAAELTGSPSLARVADEVAPVHAACLDVALRGETDPARRFGLGLTRPLYLAVHSDAAALAPAGHTLVQAAVYGAHGDPEALRAELEAAMDRLHPGWRDRVAFTRWRPHLLVAHDIPRASARGARAPVEVTDLPGVYVAGDWVGDEGWLSDAALASAGAAVDAILARAREAA